MTTPQPPPFDSIDYDALMERLIDTMTCLVSMEQDFQAAKLNLETITDILADAYNDHPNDLLKTKFVRLIEQW